MHHLQAAALMGRRPSVQAQQVHDQLLAALREAGPHGLNTAELGDKVRVECSARWHAEGTYCHVCQGTGWRRRHGGEVRTFLYQLERRRLVVGVRANYAGGFTLWRLSAEAAQAAEEVADLDEHWDWLAAQADPAPVDHVAEAVAEWRLHAALQQRDNAVQSSRQIAMDELVAGLCVGRTHKAVAELLGLTPAQVSAARDRLWRKTGKLPS